MGSARLRFSERLYCRNCVVGSIDGHEQVVVVERGDDVAGESRVQMAVVPSASTINAATPSAIVVSTGTDAMQ